jgi:hypothetical protein
VTPQLRLVVFSESIISDIGNPMATTVRAMCQAFADLGHDVTHLEERGNPALTRMLETRGYAPMRAFNERYPLIRYRQYELPGGVERAVWLGREVATIDAVVAYPGTQLGVIDELDRRDNPLLVRFSPRAEPEIRELMPLWTDPAVLSRPAHGPRDAQIIVAYDNVILAGSPDSVRLSAGTFDEPDWSYVPEVLIEDNYQRSKKVTFEESVDLARALLPVANGATTELVDRRGNRVQLLWAIPPINAAEPRAELLAAELTRTLAERSRATKPSPRPTGNGSRV